MTNDPRDLAMSLSDRARIRGASRMIPEGTTAEAITPEQIAEVAAAAKAFCERHGIKQGECAKAVGVTNTSISEFFNNKGRGNVGQLAIDVDAWVDEEDRRRAKPKTTQFVWTNVAMEIKQIADYCLDYRKVGLVYSADSYGMGKTTSLEAIAELLGPRRSTLVTLKKSNASPSGLVRTICTAMGIDNAGNNAVLVDRIVGRLKGRSHLLMIDQIHCLCGLRDDAPLYYLMEIYDASQTAQLWAGTADVLGYLQRQQTRKGDESLGQIRSRISPCVDLIDAVTGGDGNTNGGEPLFTLQQIRDVFGRNRLKLVGGAARWLCTLANLPDSGGLRTCVQLVDYINAVAEARSWTAIDVPELKAAMRYNQSSVRAQAALYRIDEQAKKTPLRAAVAG